MDAKPQRIRVRGDENALPSFHANKAIHQRNKSTPALSLMAQNAKNGNANTRRAFGDLSNAQPIRENSALPGKPATQGADTKPALSQPAQRPLSMSSAKGFLNNLASKPVNPAGKAHVTAIKNSAKNTNVVFRDQLKPVAEKETSKEVIITTQPARSDERPNGKETERDLARENDEEEEQEYFDVPSEGSTEAHIAEHSRQNREMIPSQAEATKPIPAATDVGEPRALPSIPVSNSFDGSYDNRAPEVTGPAMSEVEDSEDEDPRSYLSRTENTTGGTTTMIFPRATAAMKREILHAQSFVEANQTEEEIEEDFYDSSMVAEYSTEIFEYLRYKEIAMLPTADYMANQAEIQWSMRSVLMDWLVQVHFRFALLPETLFLCVNLIDRFLSHKIVSLGKLQLVGATAIYIAAKYEEITSPSIAEIHYMVDGGYSMDEILKAERFMLNILNYDLGWPGPMSFLRRISKADDYDLETRTVAKYFLELTIMDERFVATPPSFASAGAHCLALLMLRKGCWTMAHAHYSGYLYAQLVPVMSTMLECCEDPQRHHLAIYEKYSDRRFKRASTFVETEIKGGFKLPRPTPFNDRNRLDGVANY
ncbi:Putative G2/mitotic-specific cyclin cdc13 [Penicillium brasilianum]|uniref:Putative G2/mitotic-specific cyclin cdc13 n=1 Tax=Penicillium brasilianum TaxID=104259 RepID=A0A0F7TQZ7_PENBI|nr:Putative G2/mitotic-specific cyclin cdc13 [Penicillium brasilianum]